MFVWMNAVCGIDARTGIFPPFRAARGGDDFPGVKTRGLSPGVPSGQLRMLSGVGLE
jgi:hypothetical protein